MSKGRRALKLVPPPVAPLTLGIFFVDHSAAAQALEESIALVSALGNSEPRLRLDGRRKALTTEAIVARLARTRPMSFWVDGDGVAFRHGPNKTDFYLDITLPALPPREAIDAWIPRMTRIKHATYAKLFNAVWEDAQNAIFPDNIECLGYSTSGMKRLRDATLEMMIIDVSVNPGRRVARQRITESLGHEMWLLPKFWEVTCAARAKVAAAFPARELEQGVLAVTLAEQPFGSRNPPTEIQREILFPYARSEKMGATYTWFLANEEERVAALDGWRIPALPTGKPKRRVGHSPFSKDKLVSWDYPASPIPDADPDANDPDYEELPHFVSKLDLFEAARLMHVLTGQDPDKVWSLLMFLTLKGPEDFQGSVHLVPHELVEAFASLGDLRDVARRWATLGVPLTRPLAVEALAGYERWAGQLKQVSGARTPFFRQVA